MNIPDHLTKQGKASESNQLWVVSLVETIQRLKREWNLELGDPFTKNVSCSYVAPVQ